MSRAIVLAPSDITAADVVPGVKAATCGGSTFATRPRGRRDGAGGRDRSERSPTAGWRGNRARDAGRRRSPRRAARLRWATPSRIQEVGQRALVECTPCGRLVMRFREAELPEDELLAELVRSRPRRNDAALALLRDLLDVELEDPDRCRCAPCAPKTIVSSALSRSAIRSSSSARTVTSSSGVREHDDECPRGARPAGTRRPRLQQPRRAGGGAPAAARAAQEVDTMSARARKRRRMRRTTPDLLMQYIWGRSAGRGGAPALPLDPRERRDRRERLRRGEELLPALREQEGRRSLRRAPAGGEARRSLRRRRVEQRPRRPGVL